MIKIVGDTHTHSSACQHAYSSVLENIAQAKKLGHKFLALTEHGPILAGCPHHWYFSNIARMIPQVVDGLVILRGCEANILNGGEVDLAPSILASLDWVIGSMHSTVMEENLPAEEYTKFWLKIAENPHIDCIGHIGQERFKPDYETVIKAFAENNKVVEINSSSPQSRPDSIENCKEVIRLCKKHGVKIVLSSDAHFVTAIGQVEYASKLVEENDFPMEQIINTDYNIFAEYLYEKKGIVLPKLD